jgi:hypothetical protein
VHHGVPECLETIRGDVAEEGITLQHGHDLVVRQMNELVRVLLRAEKTLYPFTALPASLSTSPTDLPIGDLAELDSRELVAEGSGNAPLAAFLVECRPGTYRHRGR